MTPSASPAQIAEALEAVRRRSLSLLEPLSDEDQRRQHSPLMSPLVWDLAHVANYEDLWLVRAAGRRPGVRPSTDRMYDAFRHPRADRPQLPLLDPPAARSYLAEVRAATLDVLDAVALDAGDGLLDGGFVYGMVIQHEHQHDETMLATLQLMGEAAPALPGTTPAPGGAPVDRAEVAVPHGSYRVGTCTTPWAYDNERPAHDVVLDAFAIDTTAVTCAAYVEFIGSGGYDDARLWSGDGWEWRQRAGLRHPEFWRAEGERSWSVLRFGRRRRRRVVARRWRSPRLARPPALRGRR